MTTADESLRVQLEDLAPALPATLISPSRLSALRSVAGQIPAASSCFVGVECRLGKGDSAADFMFLTGDGRAQREALLHFAEAQRSAPQEVWQRLAGLARQWLGREDWEAHLKTLWLEFDVEPENLELPVPSFFVTAEGTAQQCREGALWLLDEVLPTLCERDVLSATRPQMERCLGALPPSTSAVMLGAMSSRNADFLRLCVQGLDMDGVLQYLHTIGWPGSLEALLAQMQCLAGHVDCLTVDLDVGTTLRPIIGVEYMFRRRTLPGARVEWSGLLEELVRLGVCAPERVSPLLAFALGSAGPGGDAATSVRSWRRLNHCKLVMRADCRLEAKGYLFSRYPEKQE